MVDSKRWWRTSRYPVSHVCRMSVMASIWRRQHAQGCKPVVNDPVTVGRCALVRLLRGELRGTGSQGKSLLEAWIDYDSYDVFAARGLFACLMESPDAHKHASSLSKPIRSVCLI